MEVKVQCSCGTRYKFDVEPINGQLPGPVGCPTCGADGTAAANAIIQQALSAQAAQQSAGNVQPPAAEKPRIRLNLPASPEAAPAPALDSGAAPAVPPAPLTAGRHVAIAPVRQKPSHERPGVALGIVGAVVGGFVGMLGWYFLIKATGFEIGYAAWGVGALSGIGARILGHNGSTLLGVSAAVSAFLAIIGGQFFAAKSVVNEIFEKTAQEAYESQMSSAKEAVQAVPTGSDAEIRAFLAKEAAKDGGSMEPNQVSAEQVNEFREKELPRFRDFASGKRGKKDVDKQINAVKDSFVGDLFIIKESFSLFTLLWIFLGVGSAYKIASGGSD